MNIFGWLAQQTPVSNALKLWAKGSTVGNTGMLVETHPSGLELALFGLASRQGGSATWSTTGTTDFAPVPFMAQCGASLVNIDSGVDTGTLTVTLSKAFVNTPIILTGLRAVSIVGTTLHYVVALSLSETTFDLTAKTVANTSGVSSVSVAWMALGPM